MHVVEEVRHRVLGTRSSRRHLEPHVARFKGTITPQHNDGPKEVASLPKVYQSIGTIQRVSATKLEITELPVRVWTEDYKKFLYKLVLDGSIKEVREGHSTDDILFTVTATNQQIDDQEKIGLVDFYRLKSNISLTNMHAFDQHSVIHKYLSPEEIIDAHYPVRYDAYRKRKQSLEHLLLSEEVRSRSKSNFIQDILNGVFDILPSNRPGGRSEHEIALELKSRGYPEEMDIKSLLTIDVLSSGKNHSHHSINRNNNHVVIGNTDAKYDYTYLLDMPINSLTKERSIRLKQRADEASAELSSLRAKSIKDLWLSDLDKISQAYRTLKAEHQK